MAIQVVGLKTHIWNNNIKSVLFLLLYPIIITATYMSVLAVIFMYLASETSEYRNSIDYFAIYKMIVLDLWYVPYALILIFLLLVSMHNRNRMDISEDMQTVSREKHPRLYDFLEQLCISRGLPMPYFFIQQHDSCNAYTTGLTAHTYRIVLTSTLVESLNDEEIEAVLAHELTHLINGDTRLIYLTGTVTHVLRTISGILWPSHHYSDSNPNKGISFGRSSQNGRGALFVLMLACVLKLMYIGAVFAQMFISRKREYIADAGAVELTKNPHALISALQKIEQSTFGFYHDEAIKPALIHYHNVGEISTHPPIKDRIAAIRFFSRIETPDIITRKNIREAKKANAAIVW